MKAARSVLGDQIKLFREHLSLERRLGDNTVSAYVKDLEQYDAFLVSRGKRSGGAVRVEEVRIEAGSSLVGTRLRETDWRQRGVLVMALQPSGRDTFHYIPDPESVLAPGSTVIVLGGAEHVGKLRKEAGPRS